MDTFEIAHVAERHRFEVRLGTAVVGRSYYRVEAGRRVFTHTEIEPDYQGRGLATQLIEHALTETRAAGLRIVALCPTVAAYVAKHPEFNDIVDPSGVAPS